MSEHARVESIAALMKFRAALCKFGEAVKVGLDESEADVQRTSFWLNQDQKTYWKRELNKRSELYARAKGDLNRKKMQKTALGGSYSSVDEEKALAAAERRLAEARQKSANVKRWSRLLDEESFSYKAAAQGMRLAAELEIPSALALLDNMIEALQAYAAAPAPEAQESLAPTGIAEGADVPEEYVSVARDAPSAACAAAEAYQRLRARTPARAVRNDTPITPPVLQTWEPRLEREVAQTVLADLDQARQPVAADEKIVLARDVWLRPRIYLERIAGADAGDSGWYVGDADNDEVADCDALRAGDLLGLRPDLEAVLELPVGCLIVLDGAKLEAVLDPQGRLLWPAAGAV